MKDFDLRNVPIDELSRENRERLTNAGLGLLSASRDLYDSLTVESEKIPDQRDKDAIAGVLEAIFAFADSKLVAVKASPRLPRPNDRVKLLPGQHSGVVVDYINEYSERATINLYGGLRDIHSSYETRDGDQYVRKSGNHASRTDAVLSQPTELNLHLRERTRGRKIADLWFRYHLNRNFGLERLIWHDSSISYSPRINFEDSRFPELNQQFLTNSRILLALVPSA